MDFISSYDKLVIDDNVFIYNDCERRIERLPYTVSGALAPPAISARTFDDLHNLTAGLNPTSVTIGKISFKSRSAGAARSSFRPATTSKPATAMSVRSAKSVESFIESVPPVSSGCLVGLPTPEGISGSATEPRSLLHGASAVSTPCLSDAVLKERAAASANEKMVPNFDIAGGCGTGGGRGSAAKMDRQDSDGEEMWEDDDDDGGEDVIDDDDDEEANKELNEQDLDNLVNDILSKPEEEDQNDVAEEDNQTDKSPPLSSAKQTPSSTEKRNARSAPGSAKRKQKFNDIAARANLRPEQTMERAKTAAPASNRERAMNAGAGGGENIKKPTNKTANGGSKRGNRGKGNHAAGKAYRSVVAECAAASASK